MRPLLFPSWVRRAGATARPYLSFHRAASSSTPVDTTRACRLLNAVLPAVAGRPRAN